MPLRARVIAALVAVVALTFPASVCADDLVKVDGSRLSGRVISEDANTVTFEIQSGGMTMRQKIARAKVRSLTREVREGPGYCAIPLFGMIGEEVSADAFEAALNAARASKPRYVVLVIDSPGGYTDEMARIVRLIDAHKDAEFVAYVKGKALSAAAIIALACPRIYLAPDATVGAATPYKTGPDGTPMAIEAKFQAAILAQMRASARLGGHDELWARAMTEIDVTIAVATDSGGRPILVADDPNVNGIVIKPAGKILALAAEEAVRHGLAVGTCDDPKKLNAPLGLPAWHAADERPWHVMANRTQAVKAERRRDTERLDQLTARNAYMQRVLPELRDIDRKLDALITEGEAAMRAADKLKAAYKSDGDALVAEYEAGVKRLKGAHNAAYQVNKLKDDCRSRATALDERFEKDMADHRAVMTRTAPEIQRLTTRRTELTAAAPPVD